MNNLRDLVGIFIIYFSVPLLIPQVVRFFSKKISRLWLIIYSFVLGVLSFFVGLNIWLGFVSGKVYYSWDEILPYSLIHHGFPRSPHPLDSFTPGWNYSSLHLLWLGINIFILLAGAAIFLLILKLLQKSSMNYVKVLIIASLIILALNTLEILYSPKFF